MKKLLIKLDACEDARMWAAEKNFEEIYNTCYRGDWLLWLFVRINPNDLQLLTLAKGHCANTVRHLMKDERSINAVDAAINFGNGLKTLGKLNASAANSAYSAANSTANAAYYAAYDASAAYDAANSAASAAKKENQQLTADIVRKYIPIEKFNVQQ